MDKPHLVNAARRLRREETDAEKILWTCLRRKQLRSTKFRRQEPIGNYVVDFVSFEKKLIIELDGASHASVENKDNDVVRTMWLESEGFQIIRFWNSEVTSNIDSVMMKIKKSISLS
jgi:very-short-patch-repair endonuclease